MLFTEAIKLQKTIYERIVDEFGNEEEFGEDLGCYVLSDVIRTWQLFYIAIKYLSQNRQHYTSYILLKSALNSIIVFNKCFQNYMIDRSISQSDIFNYIRNSIQEAKFIINQNKFSDNIKYIFDADKIRCILEFDDFYSKNIKLILEEFFKSNESNILNVFSIEFINNEIIISSKTNKNICKIYKNNIEMIYKLC